MRGRFALLALGLLAIGFGCKERQEGADTKGAAPAAQQRAVEQPPATPAMQAFKDDGDVLELTISGDDQMRYDTNRLTARAGQMVRLTLKHTGQLPAQAMGHNVVILKRGEDFFEFGADVGEAKGSLANHYVPEALLGRVVAYTRLIGGGQTTTVEFQVPPEAGEHPFLCSFPGHFAQMNGIFEVTQ